MKKNQKHGVPKRPEVKEASPFSNKANEFGMLG